MGQSSVPGQLRGYWSADGSYLLDQMSISGPVSSDQNHSACWEESETLILEISSE